MIPYYRIPVLDLGPIPLDPWATFACVGFIVGIDGGRLAPTAALLQSPVPNPIPRDEADQAFLLRRHLLARAEEGGLAHEPDETEQRQAPGTPRRIWPRRAAR